MTDSKVTEVEPKYVCTVWSAPIAEEYGSTGYSNVIMLPIPLLVVS